MKSLLYIFSLFLSVSLVFACRQSAFDDSVSRAEALMESEPDSALAIAETLRPSGKKEEARAALALLKARYKAYVPLSDDSLARTAAGYFTGDDTLAAQAQFFLGDTYFNQGRYDRALLAAKTGQDIADRIGDNYYAGLINRLQADIYHNTYDTDNELKYRLSSISSFSEATKSTHVLWDKIEYAEILSTTGHVEQSAKLLDSISTDTTGMGAGIQLKFTRTKAINYYFLHNYRAIIQLYETIDKHKDIWSTYDWWLLSISFALAGNYDMAEQSIDSVWQLSFDRTDTIRALSAKRILAKTKKNFEEAYHTYVLEDSMTKNYMDSVLTHPYNDLIAETSYLQANLKTIEAKNVRRILYFTIALSLMLLSVAILVIVLTRKNIKLKQLRIETLIDKLAVVDNSLRIHSDKLDKLSRDKLELTKQHLEEINLLCTEIFKLPSHAKDTQKVFKKFKGLIETFKDNNMQDFLEEYLNQKHDGVMNFLHSEFPEISEKQVSLFTYCALDFTPETTALLTSTVSANALGAAKSRLKKIFVDGATEHSNIFINLLSSYTKQPLL